MFWEGGSFLYVDNVFVQYSLIWAFKMELRQASAPVM